MANTTRQTPQQNSDPRKLLLLLGITCMPTGVDFRSSARQFMIEPGREELVVVRFLVGSQAAAIVAEERNRFGDIQLVDCPEGSVASKSVVSTCKFLQWYKIALAEFPPAHFYGKLEDDHFAAMNLLASDLRGLIGNSLHLPLAYGVGMWQAYDAKRFWGPSSGSDDGFPRSMADGGCFLGSTCASKHKNARRLPNEPYIARLPSENTCAKVDHAAFRTNLGEQNLTYYPGKCHVQSPTEVFPFMGSGEIISRSIAMSVAHCKYATDFVDRAMNLTRGWNHTSNTLIPGADCVSGHFWNRCLSSRTILLAVLPLVKAHQIRAPSSSRHMSLPPWRQSVIIHGLKFYVREVNAPMLVEHAYNLTKSEMNGTCMPPLLLEFTFATPTRESTMRHASLRVGQVNTIMLEKSGVMGFPNGWSAMARSMQLITYSRTDKAVFMWKWSRHQRLVDGLWNKTSGDFNIHGDLGRHGSGNLAGYSPAEYQDLLAW